MILFFCALKNVSNPAGAVSEGETGIIGWDFSCWRGLEVERAPPRPAALAAILFRSLFLLHEMVANSDLVI